MSFPVQGTEPAPELLRAFRQRIEALETELSVLRGELATLCRELGAKVDIAS